MTDFTHTYEIVFDGVSIEGEISFNHGQNVVIKDNGCELTIKQRAKLQAMFETIQALALCCPDEIVKIEVVKK